MPKTKPLTPQQIDELVKLYEQRTCNQFGHTTFAAALVAEFPALLATLAEKDELLAAKQRFIDEQTASVLRFMEGHRAELQQANERAAKLGEALLSAAIDVHHTHQRRDLTHGAINICRNGDCIKIVALLKERSNPH